MQIMTHFEAPFMYVFYPVLLNNMKSYAINLSKKTKCSFVPRVYMLYQLINNREREKYILPSYIVFIRTFGN